MNPQKNKNVLMTFYSFYVDYYYIEEKNAEKCGEIDLDDMKIGYMNKVGNEKRCKQKKTSVIKSVQRIRHTHKKKKTTNTQTKSK